MPLAIAVRPAACATASTPPSSEHPLVDVEDQAGLLGQRQELLGRLHTALGMLPAHQGLERLQAVVFQCEHRLVVQGQARALHGLAQPRLELELRGLLVGLDAAAPPLGLVHREVGFPNQLLRLGLLAASARDPDAGLDRDAGPAEREWLGDRATRSLGHPQGLALSTQVFAQDHELIAAVAGHGVARAQHPPQPVRDLDQQFVAGVVAEVVVDALEAIEVEEQQQSAGS
jgi:hypothetical protein